MQVRVRDTLHPVRDLNSGVAREDMASNLSVDGEPVHGFRVDAYDDPALPI